MSRANESKPIGLRSQSQALRATCVESASGEKSDSDLKLNRQFSLFRGLDSLDILTSPVNISITVTSQQPGGVSESDLSRFTTLKSRSLIFDTPFFINFAASNISSVTLTLLRLSISSESSLFLFAAKDSFLGRLVGSWASF